MAPPIPIEYRNFSGNTDSEPAAALPQRAEVRREVAGDTLDLRVRESRGDATSRRVHEQRIDVEQDEPGPDAMADHLLFLLGQGLPSSLLTGKGPVPPQAPMAEN